MFHVPAIPVCFGEYPKVLENPISVSQINRGGDLEAGGGLFYPFGLYGRSAWGQGKYLRLKKVLLAPNYEKRPAKLKIQNVQLNKIRL